MAHKEKRQAIEAAILSMGGGVGLATLEAMFNMVNTQSLISAGMIRDHDLSQPLQLQAQAAALAKILALQDGACVTVDIPQNAAPKAKSDDAEGYETGAILGSSELLNKVDRNTTNITSTTTTQAADMLHQENRLTALETKMDGVLVAMSSKKQPDWW